MTEIYKDIIIFHCTKAHGNKLVITERNKINDFQLWALYSP